MTIDLADVKTYFSKLDSEVEIAYDLANRCRSKGLDPSKQVEIMLAKNMAERVVGLISVVCPELKNSSLVRRIEELEKEYGAQDWRVALTVALEVTKEKFCKFEDVRKAMEVGLRVGIAYITNGVVSSPLEGFTRLEIKKRRDGKEYLALYYSGPIRSAGGTAASVSVIIGDYIRKNMGYSTYDPSEDEVRRICTEILDYHERITNLQYLPSDEEVSFLIKYLPVQISGDPSEMLEVSNYKGLDRIETDRIRNGVCLVIGEGLGQKAPKLVKQLSVWGNEFELDDWKFLGDFVKLQKKIKAGHQVEEEKEKDTGSKLKPDHTYIKDIVAGRPVFTHPLRSGGFRLRYGRTRVSGFSSQAIHPATMVVLNKFIAMGTQLKVERPGKSSVLSACDTVDGPIVKLKDGSVMKLKTIDEANSVKADISEILYLGDILICYGDFFNRGHMLVPVGYCEEWWAQELLVAVSKKDVGEFEGVIDRIKKNYFEKISFDEAHGLSKKFGIPMHPRYTYFWSEIEMEDLKLLKKWSDKGNFLESKAVFPFLEDSKSKRALELLGVPHKVVSNEYVVISGEDAKAIKFYFENVKLDNVDNPLEAFSKDFLIRDKSGTFIGARMGRPEKAKMRKMTGSPHVLFPVGTEGGRHRSFQSALEGGIVRSQFPMYKCECGDESIYPLCGKCGKETNKMYACRRCGITDKECHSEMIKNYMRMDLDVSKYFNSAVNISGVNRSMLPDMIKGVRGTSNKNHTPEHLAKGILRAVHKIYVNKDGTTRYDMTEMPLTHFKPKEVGTSLEKLKQLGYTLDIHGKEIVDDNQVLELKIQDIVLPAASEALDETSDRVFIRVAAFIDDLLEKVYGEKRFYKARVSRDLVGQLVVGLAPHISAGAVARVIGFSNTQCVLAHPYFHSMVRRDCDGDELCVMLLLDALLNFSKEYLPDHRGSTQDAPLVLTSILTPAEVDDMVFDMDIAWKYPLEMYVAAENFKMPWDVKVSQLKERLGSDEQFFGIGYTHDVSDLNDALSCSAYKSIPTMGEKVDGQMDIAQKVRAVDTDDVARLVIERHFIRDIKGNLRKFSTQQFRCVKCNEKYRRPPIAGHCIKGKCLGKIIFTISQGSIIKYLEPSLRLSETYNIPSYLKETLILTKLRIESIFGKAEEKQEGLVKFFG